jgi:TolB-like protein
LTRLLPGFSLFTEDGLDAAGQAFHRRASFRKRPATRSRSIYDGFTEEIITSCRRSPPVRHLPNSSFTYWQAGEAEVSKELGVRYAEEIRNPATGWINAQLIDAISDQHRG